MTTTTETFKKLIDKITPKINPFNVRQFYKNFSIAKTINYELKIRNIEFDELAKTIKVSHSFLKNILNGKTYITIETIFKIEEALKTDIILTPAQYYDEFLNNPEKFASILNCLCKESLEIKKIVNNYLKQ